MTAAIRKAVPFSAKSPGTAAPASTHMEVPTVPDATHRPVTLTYSANGVSVVADLPDRPELVATTVDPVTATAWASFRCGPLKIRFDDPAAAASWASALAVTAAALRIATDNAAELKRTETAAAS